MIVVVTSAGIQSSLVYSNFVFYDDCEFHYLSSRDFHNFIE